MNEDTSGNGSRGREGTPAAELVYGLPAVLPCGLLIWAVLDLPVRAGGLSGEVWARMDQSGVTSPITAVLLNFRGYDTLLEVCVLLLASIGSLTVRGMLPSRPSLPGLPPGPVLEAMIRLLAPLMVMVAGYLLWAGEHAPGGAFQAGAVLGAAGVLLFLGDRVRLPQTHGWVLRLALALGFCAFLIVAGSGLVSGRSLLEYPRAWAGEMILLLETVVTLSIAVVLITLFAVNPPASSSVSIPDDISAGVRRTEKHEPGHSLRSDRG